MTLKTKVRKIGNSYGILLPKEAMKAMMVKEGDVLYLTEAPEQSVRMTRGDERYERVMEIVERGMHRYQNALRELAK